MAKTKEELSKDLQSTSKVDNDMVIDTNEDFTITWQFVHKRRPEPKRLFQNKDETDHRSQNTFKNLPPYSSSKINN